MEPTTWIAIASGASAIAALSSAWVALESHARERRWAQRAEVYATAAFTTSVGNRIRLTIWNEGPGTAYDVAVKVRPDPLVRQVLGDDGPSADSYDAELDDGPLILPAGNSLRGLCKADGPFGQQIALDISWTERATSVAAALASKTFGASGKPAAYRRRTVAVDMPGAASGAS